MFDKLFEHEFSKANFQNISSIHCLFYLIDGFSKLFRKMVPRLYDTKAIHAQG